MDMLSTRYQHMVSTFITLWGTLCERPASRKGYIAFKNVFYKGTLKGSLKDILFQWPGPMFRLISNKSIFSQFDIFLPFIMCDFLCHYYGFFIQYKTNYICNCIPNFLIDARLLAMLHSECKLEMHIRFCIF